MGIAKLFCGRRVTAREGIIARQLCAGDPGAGKPGGYDQLPGPDRLAEFSLALVEFAELDQGAGHPVPALRPQIGGPHRIEEERLDDIAPPHQHGVEHPEGARVRPDQKVVFFDEWDTAEERLKGATDILRTLVGIAEKGKKTA